MRSGTKTTVLASAGGNQEGMSQDANADAA